MTARQQTGISIIEILMILGAIAVLASMYTPGFSERDTRDQLSIAKTAGDFGSQVRLARAQWFTNGQNGVDRIDGFADGRVWSGKRGWPISHKAGDRPSSLSADHCARLWNGLMGDGVPRAQTAGEHALLADSDTQSGVCSYRLQQQGEQHVIIYSTLTGRVSYF